tara:strand:+ start:4476 stop:5315 length:840 start_codon:yes stop_codon:yes gene_type:complete
MRDYSADYNNNKKGMVYFSNGEIAVKFKPFVESFSFSFSNDSTTPDGHIYTKKVEATKFKESKYSISFGLPATSLNEAISNHNKFQVLMRMIAPKRAENFTEPRKVFLKFSNLISNSGQKGKISMSAKQILEEGFRGIINDLKYEPDMEMGFFEFNGLLFAKAFNLNIDVIAIPFLNATTSPSFVSGYNYGRKEKISFSSAAGNSQSSVVGLSVYEDSGRLIDASELTWEQLVTSPTPNTQNNTGAPMPNQPSAQQPVTNFKSQKEQAKSRKPNFLKEQ